MHSCLPACLCNYMLWLMNTFNKSSSYLIQVFTVAPSVLPSSTVFSVYKPENGGKGRFSCAKKWAWPKSRRASRAIFVPSTPLNLKSWIRPWEGRYMKREVASNEGGMYSNSKKKLMINKKRKMVDKDNSKMLRLKDSSQKEVMLKKVSEILIIIMSIY